MAWTARMASTWHDSTNGGKQTAQRSCNTKPSQRLCNTKPAQRTCNGVVSLWKWMVLPAVLRAPNFATKNGRMVCHNSLVQLIALLGWAQKIFGTAIKANCCSRHKSWSLISQRRPVGQANASKRTKTKKNEKKSRRGFSLRLLFTNNSKK